MLQFCVYALLKLIASEALNDRNIKLYNVLHIKYAIYLRSVRHYPSYIHKHL